MKKVSIIIPVYNGEAYLQRCIDSILKQKGFPLDSLEVILINDGSTDGSLKVLNENRKNYPKTIRVINRENRGIASTRNEGVALAHTKWLMFMDQDDWIDSDYVTTFYEEAERGQYDVVLGGMRRLDSQGRLKGQLKLRNTKYAKYVPMSMWAKIHRTSFVKDNNIKVFENTYGEDLPFTLKEYSLSQRVKTIEYIGYNWFYNERSVSNTKQRNLQTNFDQLLRLLNEIKKYDDSSDEYEYFVIQNTIFYLLWGGKNLDPRAFIDYQTKLFIWLEHTYPQFKKNKYVFFGAAGATRYSRVATSIFILVDKLHLMGVFARIYCRGRLRAKQN